jgi:ADP-heptose:LPS heptosyltransferase
MKEVTVVIKPGNVGDHVCALPLYVALVEKYGPVILITQTGRNGNPGARDLFCSWSPFEQIFELGTPVWKTANYEVLDFIRSQYKPVRILHLPVENYSLLRACGLHGFWCATFRRNLTGFLPTSNRAKRADLAKNGHLSSETSRLLDWARRSLEVPAVDITPVMTKWLSTIAGKRQVDKLPSPFVVIAAGTNDSVKSWPLDRYIAIAEWLQSELHLTPVWVGGTSDQATLESAGFTLPGVSLIGKTSLEDVLLLVSKAQCVICNDSMAGHLAALTNTPCLSIFSARTLPGLWWPQNVNGAVIQKRLPCEGCELRHVSDCPNAHSCITTISTEEVTELLAAKLKRNDDSAQYKKRSLKCAESLE